LNTSKYYYLFDDKTYVIREKLGVNTGSTFGDTAADLATTIPLLLKKHFQEALFQE
jgi:hypothetical protein